MPPYQINSGRVTDASAILDEVLADSPRELGALIARGTARALLRDLQGEPEGKYVPMWGSKECTNDTVKVHCHLGFM